MGSVAVECQLMNNRGLKFCVRSHSANPARFISHPMQYIVQHFQNCSK